MSIRARAAVIGCGAISKEHLHVLGAHPRIELVGVCDRSPVAAGWTAERYGTRAYTDHLALLEHGRPDVVHVLTPPSSHAAIAADALRAGAHVIVEKPITASAEQLAPLQALAASQGLLLTENHNYRFNDQIIAIDQLVAAGQLGRVVSVDVLIALEVAGGRLAAADGNPTAHLAGGAVRDFLTHLTYLGLHFLPDAPVDAVEARWANRSGSAHVGADELLAQVEVGGRSALLRFDGRAKPDCFRIWVRGDRGSAETDLFQPFLRVETPRVSKQLSPVIGHAHNGVTLAAASVRNLRDKVLQRTPYHGLWRMLDLFYAAVLDGTPPPVSADDVRRTNDVIDRIVADATERSRP